MTMGDVIRGVPVSSSSGMERTSKRLDIGRLFALRSLLDIEADLLIFFEGFESLGPHFREVCEQVFAAIVRGNEAKSFRIVKPLYRAGRHSCVQSRIELRYRLRRSPSQVACLVTAALSHV